MRFLAITVLLEVVKIPETPALPSNELLTSEPNLCSDFPHKQCGQGDASTWSLLTRWKGAHKAQEALSAVLKNRVSACVFNAAQFKM